MTLELINDTKKLTAMTIALGKAGAKFDQNLHLIAYNYLAMIENTSDIRPMIKLYTLLTPANQRALRVWAIVFGKVKYDSKTNTLGFAKAGTTDLEAAAAISPLAYEKAKKTPVHHVFDLKAELDKLVARAIKASVTGKPVELLQQAAAAA